MVQFVDDHRAGLGVEPICAVFQTRYGSEDDSGRKGNFRPVSSARSCFSAVAAALMD